MFITKGNVYPVFLCFSTKALFSKLRIILLYCYNGVIQYNRAIIAFINYEITYNVFPSLFLFTSSYKAKL